MPDTDIAKVDDLAQRLADVKKRNAYLQSVADDRARRVAMLEEKVRDLQAKLDDQNGF